MTSKVLLRDRERKRGKAGNCFSCYNFNGKQALARTHTYNITCYS